MADAALTAITEATTIDGADLLYSVVGANSRKVKRSNLFKNATTLTASDPFSITQTWNAGGVTFNGLLVNATDTASAAASTLLDLQKAGVSQFKVDKSGAVTAVASLTLGATGGTGGSTKLFGATSGDATIRVAAAAGTATIFQLPASNGTSGYFLKTDGAGATSWDAAGGGGGGITVNTTTITGGTSGRVLYDNAGTVGEKLVTGTGDVVLATSPTMVTPTLGVASATTLALPFAAGSDSAVDLRFAGVANTGIWAATQGILCVTVEGTRMIDMRAGVNFPIGIILGAVGGSSEVKLISDADNIMAQRNGVTAQKFRVYGTFTDASNYERGALNTGADYVELAAETLGTGDDDLDVRLTPAGTGKVRYGTHSALAAETVTGYITIKDSGGTSRKIAVVS